MYSRRDICTHAQYIVKGIYTLVFGGDAKRSDSGLREFAMGCLAWARGAAGSANLPKRFRVFFGTSIRKS